MPAEKTVEKVKAIEYKFEALPTHVDTSSNANAGGTKSSCSITLIISTSPVEIDGIALNNKAMGKPRVFPRTAIKLCLSL